jgi:selenocysteine lyase/cysteine desulfurase
VGEEDLERCLAEAAPGKANLFAFPAQSNFSGVRHSLDWIGRAREAGWDVLLDAAAYVPTSRLDLSRHQPDFVTVSFYKMFGYPTGVGALIARKEALSRLQRPWFAGGTITMASVQADAHFLASGAAAFEEGTPNYGAIPAVSYGLDMLESVGMETVGARVSCLTRYLLDHLRELRHDNGSPLIRLYGPWSVEDRGGTVTLNFYDSRGLLIDHQDIEGAATARRISLRTGCFCNPGAGELAMGLSKEEMTHCLLGSREGMTYNEFRRCIDDKDTGAVRVSLGLVSNQADVDAFLDFSRSFLD